MMAGGRFTDSALQPGSPSSNTTFISPPLSPSHLTQPAYSSVSTPPTQFRRIHSRSFLPIQTSNTVSTPPETLDQTTKIILYTLFFIISSLTLTSLIVFLNHISKLYKTKLQKRYNSKAYGELEQLMIRRNSTRYSTMDETSSRDEEENGRPASSTRSTESGKGSNGLKDTKATKATKVPKATKGKVTKAIKPIKPTKGKVTKPTKPTKPIKPTKSTDSHPSEPTQTTDSHSHGHPSEPELSRENAQAPPNPRKVAWVDLPQPTRQSHPSKQPTSLQFAASPPHSPPQPTVSHPTEPEWESAPSSRQASPKPRKIGWASLPQPIRPARPPAGPQFVAPPRSARSNRPNPPKRLRSPPLSPDFLTISNATTAPMTIPGHEPSSWVARLPWATAADGPHIRDEGKREREMDADDEGWGDIDKIIDHGRAQYARDRETLDAAERRDREGRFVGSRGEGNNCLSGSEQFWGY
ncbi:hypothetical protein EAE96_011463 [Botrytis aclada]|nr:hypothetical protein EAE96_011463 [Botrytis aclada]